MTAVIHLQGPALLNLSEQREALVSRLLDQVDQQHAPGIKNRLLLVFTDHLLERGTLDEEEIFDGVVDYFAGEKAHSALECKLRKIFEQHPMPRLATWFLALEALRQIEDVVWAARAEVANVVYPD